MVICPECETKVDEADFDDLKELCYVCDVVAQEQVEIAAQLFEY